MGWVNGWLGGSTFTEPEEPTPSPPIPAPLAVTDPAYEDHTARMIDRLPQYAKRKVE